MCYKFVSKHNMKHFYVNSYKCGISIQISHVLLCKFNVVGINVKVGLHLDTCNRTCTRCALVTNHKMSSHTNVHTFFVSCCLYWRSFIHFVCDYFTIHLTSLRTDAYSVSIFNQFFPELCQCYCAFLLCVF